MSQTYWDLMHNPPKEAKGFTRWWWYGCAVTKEEISRQLKLMSDANIGGVEIQVLYPVSKDDTSKGIKNIPYFSPEFFDVINHTVEKCESLGMSVDFTLGSSWPFGGPFVPQDMAPQSVIPYQIDVYGPCAFNYDFTTRISGDITRVIMGRMEKGKMVLDSIKDITHQVKEKYLFKWPWGYELKEIEIPEGNWKIVAFVVARLRHRVLGPALNAEGYTIDHCRKDVSDHFFAHGGQPLVDKIGVGKIRSFFCDSIELEGNNWTSILFDEFRKRRGYDLEPYIYALWGEVEDISQNIRFDYFKTMSELTIENFFENFTAWCHKNHTKSRIQAHGTWGDILKAYGSADIPEGETFGEHDCFKVNTIHRRLATSAGHIYNKPIISNESFTWLRMPRYLVTLEQMKAAVDAIFLDGINHIINHGYTYTPENIEDPGWPFYASTHICHDNTWWPYYKYLSQYIHTVTAFLQKGTPHVEIAVYIPQNDIWAESPMADLHMSMKLSERMVDDNMDAISKAGYYFDYINDEAIQEIGDINHQGLVVNDNVYHTIILMNCKRVPLKTAQNLKRFVEKGGKLIAYHQIPSEACSFLDRESQRNELVNMMKTLFPQSSTPQWSRIGNGETLYIEDSVKTMIEQMSLKILPDLKVTLHNEEIGYVHRKDDDKDIYFVANVSNECKATKLEIKKLNKPFVIYDLLDKMVLTCQNVISDHEKTTISLTLKAYQSVVIIFDESCETFICPNQKMIAKKEIDLTKDWELTVPEKNVKYDQATVDTWEKYSELMYYSGQGVYATSFIIDNEMIEMDSIELQFEQICEIGEIWINGSKVGVLWKSPRHIEVKNALINGLNQLTVKVTNLLINKAIDPNKKTELYEGPLMEEWPYFSETINMIRRKRIDNWREKKVIHTSQLSGIKGYVKLIGKKYEADDQQ